MSVLSFRSFFLLLAVVVLSARANAVSSLWVSSSIPGLVDGGPDNPVELGVKFRSDVAGTITAIRFYKAAANTGTHVGSLWSSAGTLLATATFTGETASGWQQVNLSSPVTVTAGTVYVASYHCSNGHYSADVNYFSSARDNAPLHALSSLSGGGNGVYRYGTGNQFPYQTWNAANYWVDVVFQSGPPPVLASIAVTPAGGSILPGATQQYSATGSYSDGTTRNVSSQAAWSSSSPPIVTISASGLAGGVSAGITTLSATLSGVSGNTVLTVQSAPLAVVTSTLPGGTVNMTYKAILSATGGALPYIWSVASGSLPPGLTINGTSGVISGTPTAAGASNFTVQVSDTSTVPQSATKTLSLTVAGSAPVTLWASTVVPGLVDGGADSSVELGVKFRTEVAGMVTGMRFYKAEANTGTHVGNLWSSTGTLLATATFNGETASGWQQVDLSSPVAITADTIYVASYHCNSGHYSVDLNYFASARDNAPLHAPSSVSGVGNGVYRYGTGNLFPNQTWNAANYWVDVVFQAAPPPTLIAVEVTPAGASIPTGASQQYMATGTFSDGSTQNLTNQATWSSSSTSVASMNTSGLSSGLSAGTTTISAISSGVSGNTKLTVHSPPISITTVTVPGGAVGVPYSTSLLATGGTQPYTWSLAGGTFPAGLAINGSSGVISGTPTAAGTSIFTVQVSEGGGTTVTNGFSIAVGSASSGAYPILVLTSAANPFAEYYSEILLAEGLNQFDIKDISLLSTPLLNQYQVVILGELAVSNTQVTALSDWVNAGGNLIAMRPDKKLAGLLGLTDAGSTLSEGYILLNTASGPGVGIAGQTMQFHGTADRYTPDTATSLAMLYSSAQSATVNPAVTLRSVGANGGQAAAFTFDLARSVVYTRQGNPAWAGQDRDGIAPLRSDDLFFGAAGFDPKPDWNDFNKIAIPQADEQQRLLANMILFMNADKNLLPRFWYFPNGHAAVVVMTGDDHANNGTSARFDQYAANSPANGSMDDWETIRGSSYIYPNTPVTDARAAAYHAAGFEIGLHLNTGCANYTQSSLTAMFAAQLDQFGINFPGLPAPVTHRSHCIAWSGYTILPEVGLLFGIRLDTTYYYYPAGWVADRPGLFTGSGMAMRFAKADGSLIDVYQAATQMTDESGQSYPYTSDVLLDRALGPEGYYGAFVANMHTDSNTSAGSDAILSSALTRGVPIISARQLLSWLDARNAATLKSISWSNNTQNFSVEAPVNARGLQAMLPVPLGSSVGSVRRNGSPFSYFLKQVKGIQYAFIAAETGNYEATFVPDTTPPAVVGISPPDGALEVSPAAGILVHFSEALNASTISAGTIFLRDSLNNAVPGTVSFNPSTFIATLTPQSPLLLSATYIAGARGGVGGVADLAGNIIPEDHAWSFSTTSSHRIWTGTEVPVIADAGQDRPVELGVKFQSDVAGMVTGIRFYKSAANTGTHVAHLWTSGGNLLATATFAQETSSGWQQVNFSSPVGITANTLYVASYHCPNGHYSADFDYFSVAGRDNRPLYALATGVSSGNGVYAYGESGVFPNQTYQSTNYWVDVAMQTAP